MRLIISPDYEQCSQWAADYVAYKIKAARPTENKPFVMAIPAGSSPLGMFERLIGMFRKGRLSFQNVVIFNMDEYVGLSPEYGGIDLLIGGVGEDGHVAFNEPGSSLASRTRVKTLNKNTVKANARFFDDNTDLVPRNVLTIGIATIMDAKEVMIIASGDKKAKALHCAIEGSVNHMCPVSILQMHPHALIVCDEEATSELKAETVRYFKENEEVKMPQKRR